MIIGLIALCVLIYVVGGFGKEVWKYANTKIRDWGCSACIFGLMWFIYGWSWWYPLGFVIAWGGLSWGDDWFEKKVYWIVHAGITGMSMLPYTIVNHDYLCFGLMFIAVVGGTYIVSRWLDRLYIDVVLRGLLYATMPLWFLIKF